jgi:hypothetical protein
MKQEVICLILLMFRHLQERTKEYHKISEPEQKAIIFRHLPEETEEYHKIPEPEQTAVIFRCLHEETKISKYSSNNRENSGRKSTGHSRHTIPDGYRDT